ncbi:MAG: translation initiation factor [Candidatus Nanoarchaeia archaeon]|nr:translation initiation factor [Candidatus Nanoarchaeia archaeon]
MVEICPKCGLPQELCMCEELARENQLITISLETGRYRKKVTLIEGFDNSINLKEITKKLKNKFACGGTMKNGVISLQGDFTKYVKDFLIQEGFKPESINATDLVKKK